MTMKLSMFRLKLDGVDKSDGDERNLMVKSMETTLVRGSNCTACFAWDRGCSSWLVLEQLRMNKNGRTRRMRSKATRIRMWGGCMSP